MTAPLFTICIVAHQTAPYLTRALDSVAGQSFTDYTALIVVEESTDDSLAIARQYAQRDPRFLAVSLPCSGSASVSRNYAIDHATGRYIVFLDGDDWLYPEALATAAGKLRQHPGLDILNFACQELYAQPDGSFVTGEYYANLPASSNGRIYTGCQYMSETASSGVFRGYTFINICRTGFLRQQQLYQNPGLRMEDYEWAFRALTTAQSILFLNAPLYAYRRHPGSVTTTASARILFDLIAEFGLSGDFLRTRHLPPAVERSWANKWCAIFFQFFFHPGSRGRYRHDDLLKAQKLLFSPGNLPLLRRFAAIATIPKRLGMQCFFASRFLGLWLPQLYFTLGYYPLISLRKKN